MAAKGMTPKRVRKGGESYGSCTASASRTCRQIGERGLERGVVGVLPVLVEVQGKPTVLMRASYASQGWLVVHQHTKALCDIHSERMASPVENVSL